jgi:hypothetical protein
MTSSALATIRLPERLFGLLREVLERRAPELSTVLREGSQVVIREDQKRVIQELVGDEFAETGLRSDDEPSQRGLDLEKLIDAFSPYT